LRCHWTFNAPLLQVAATLKLAETPAVTVASAGCWVIVSTRTAAATVNAALLLVALPARLLTTARKTAPVSVGAVAAMA